MRGQDAWESEREAGARVPSVLTPGLPGVPAPRRDCRRKGREVWSPPRTQQVSSCRARGSLKM